MVETTREMVIHRRRTASTPACTVICSTTTRTVDGVAATIAQMREEFAKRSAVHGWVTSIRFTAIDQLVGAQITRNIKLKT